MTYPIRLIILFALVALGTLFISDSMYASLVSGSWQVGWMDLSIPSHLFLWLGVSAAGYALAVALSLSRRVWPVILFNCFVCALAINLVIVLCATIVMDDLSIGTSVRMLGDGNFILANSVLGIYVALLAITAGRWAENPFKA